MAHSHSIASTTVPFSRHHLPSSALRRALTVVVLLAHIAQPALAVEAASPAAELKPPTLAAFDRYVRLTETQIQSEVSDLDRFVWLDRQPEPRRSQILDELRQGKLVIERLRTLDNGKEIEVPDGMIHHWLGLIFIPGIKMMDAVSLTLDYNNHAKTFAPEVVLSRIVRRDGNRFDVNMRFKKKKVITVVIDTQQDVTFTPINATHAHLRASTTRVQQVENYGEKDEKLLPVGNDSGFMWRLNTYWRYLERDGGAYIQCESVTLTRNIPFLFRPIIGPYVSSVPRESLTFTLATTRNVLLSRKPSTISPSTPK